jgi:ABC exporter DevB family membrane fusion protein
MRIAAIFLTGLALGAAGALVVRSNADGGGVQPPDGARLVAGATSEKSAGLARRRAVMALGTIEPRDGIVQIGTALVGFQVQHVRVKDGQFVNPGDVLVELDASAADVELRLAVSQRDEALERQQAEITLAQQRVASAQLAVEQAGEGRGLELDLQQSRLSVAAARQKQAHKDVERLEELRKLPEPLATEQQVEHLQVALEAAAAEHEAAQLAVKRLEQTLAFQQQTGAAELRAAEQSLALAEKGTGIESLNRRLELAELKSKQTKIIAPTAGVVLSVMAHPGEVVTQQPLVQIADLDNLIAAVEVEAGDVPYLQADQPATIRCRAFQDSVLEGTVDRVGNRVTQPTLSPLDPRKAVDRDVTRVVVQIDSRQAARLINSSDKDRRAALVGLQVEVSFPVAHEGR